MLKSLQLYTVCIVVIVIVLSLFTLLSDAGYDDKNVKTSKKDITLQKEKKQNDGMLETITDTKYGQPIKEVLDTINEVDKTVNKFKYDFDEMKDMFDLEKMFDDFDKMMQEE